jgi:hypothetical protein
MTCGTILETLCKYCHDVNVDALLLDQLRKISFTDSWRDILNKIEYSLLNIENAPQTFDYVKENFIKIIEKMMTAISDFDNARQIPFLFKKYKHNYNEYAKSYDGFINLCTVIESVLKASEEDLKMYKEDSIMDIDDVSYLYDDIDYLGRELKSELFPNIWFDYDFGVEFDENYWKEKIKGNLLDLLYSLEAPLGGFSEIP